jgi:myo-inositol-1(or 4)-monophosphatase
MWEPQLQELFAAEVGQGATLNGETISASKQSEMEKAVVQVGRGSTADAIARFGLIMPEVNRSVRTLRAIGATALAACYTACGRFDAHIGGGTYLYDGIAGGVIASEAGAMVTDFQGKPWNPPIGGMADFLVSNHSLHSDFIAILSDI